MFEKLVQREKYMNSFVSYTGMIKHGEHLRVHQYRNETLTFVNNEIPSVFKVKTQEKKKLSDFQAYYLRNCLLKADFISANLGQPKYSYSLHVILFQYTLDTIEKSKATKINPNYIRRIDVGLQEYFNQLQKINLWLLQDIRQGVAAPLLADLNDCFTENYLIVNKKGKARLKKERPVLFRNSRLK